MRTVRRFRRTLPEIPRSRRFVERTLAAHGARSTDDVLLVVSELVTNAVRHGWGDVELRIELDLPDVRVEVLDDGHADVRATEGPPSPDAVGGRGLQLVRKVARDWGSGFDPAGRTVVWAAVRAG